jgi:hypothetical protein
MMSDKDKLIEDLVAALKAVQPYATRWHDRMARMIGDTYDAMDKRERETYPFVLQEMIRYMDEGRRLREQIRDALQHAEDFEWIQEDLSWEALEGSL